jgi:heme A synthase
VSIEAAAILASAMVLCMVLYLLDKHGMMKKALLWLVGISVVLLFFVLGGAWVSYKYQDWKIQRYTKQHMAWKEKLVTRYRSVKSEALDDICRDPLWHELTEGEKDEVIRDVSRGISDRASLEKCN